MYIELLILINFNTQKCRYVSCGKHKWHVSTNWMWHNVTIFVTSHHACQGLCNPIPSTSSWVRENGYGEETVESMTCRDPFQSLFGLSFLHSMTVEVNFGMTDSFCFLDTLSLSLMVCFFLPSVHPWSRPALKAQSQGSLRFLPFLSRGNSFKELGDIVKVSKVYKGFKINEVWWWWSRGLNNGGRVTDRGGDVISGVWAVLKDYHRFWKPCGFWVGYYRVWVWVIILIPPVMTSL